MANPFEIVAQRLADLGVYNFLLPWLITSAIVWALLKKSQVFGENAVVINSVLSISVSFFIWGFLVLTGTDIAGPLSKFFTQMVFIGIGFAVILLVGSLFFPDFPKTLGDKIEGEGIFWIIVVIGVVIAIGAGLINLGGTIYNALHSFTAVPGGDVGVLIVAGVVLLLLLTIISA